MFGRSQHSLGKHTLFSEGELSLQSVLSTLWSTTDASYPEAAHTTRCPYLRHHAVTQDSVTALKASTFQHAQLTALPGPATSEHCCWNHSAGSSDSTEALTLPIPLSTWSVGWTLIQKGEIILEMTSAPNLSAHNIFVEVSYFPSWLHRA